MAKKKKKKLSSPKLRKNSKIRKKKLRHELDPSVKRGIWSIVLFAVALLGVLSFFEKAGKFGEIFNSLLTSVFGLGAYLVPLALAAVAMGFIFSWNRETNKSTVLAAFLFFSGILGIFSVSGYPDFAEVRGGYWGYLYVWPLVNFFGEVAALVILIASVIIAVIIGFHIRVDKYMERVVEKKKIKKGALELKQTISKEDEKKTKDIKKEILVEGGGVEVRDYNKNRSSDEKSNKKSPEDKKESFAQLSQGEYANYELPSLDLLEPETGKPMSGDIIASANIIKRTLQNFGIDVEMSEVNVGPTVTQYTLKPAEGVKLARITALGNDLSLALAAHPIRIEAPIPGRSLVGIEIPNKAATWVRIKNLIENKKFLEQKGDLILAIGRDVKGAPVYADLSKMPHMLIAGSTGSGKTIALNAVIMSLVYRNHPRHLRFILIDPKRVEFSVYADMPHLLAPIVVDSHKAINALKWAVGEMERRFEVLSEVGARDIFSYNSNKQVIKENNTLPYIVIAIDELADLMSSKGREVEALIVRIAQMARAVGMHLVLATQRPSVEVITGLIKANITARMAFQVASQVDSRTVLDMAGAEKLLGRGDMLWLSPERSKPIRVQGAYVGEEEIKKVANHLRNQKDKLRESEEGSIKVEDFSVQAVQSPTKSIDFDETGSGMSDEFYEEAKQLVIEAKKASASYLQRKLRVGYARAASLLDMLEENGIVGPGEGSKPREVYVQEEDALDENKDIDTDKSEIIEEDESPGEEEDNEFYQ